ncbi:alanine--tRNA ligase [Miltoncostaea marina]|uniref:alanine--tRNA ligase n=1 Tax=Miltoncostaea marina TaxID=2843215 RepID=UPI001C3C8B34|nr:alanine--tRNA ligase [Miltoncostaea marina]
MTTSEIRAAFLRYFERQGHLAIPSASLVPFEDDPSVLLTIAGMQPLKSYFLGAASPPAPRMTSSQKCFRTNDIDQVGHTARHLTFFEMLGNFSIGDYFKDDAIRFGWEVSTEVFGLDPERIWITIFEGMPGVPADEEAFERWVALGVPPERIQRLGDPDNFWKAGPTGPCGPNTELYLDRGEAFGPPGGPASGSDRYLEYWNLVFMQYDRGPDGSLSGLPAKNIDTGAGLERLAAILQDVPSVFDTDAFRPLIAWAEGASGRAYGRDARDDRALRVLADHGRAMTFLAADGVRPGNEGRDYILRRIVRRAVSEAGHLGLEPEAVAGLAAPVVEGWGDAYPELRERAAEVRDVIGAEAEQFARTLSQGRRLLAEVIERSAGGRVRGEDAFRLHDTYGFPLDLTLEAAGDAGLEVDAEGFERLMREQRERSRAGAGAGADGVADGAAALAREAAPTEFVGWDATTADTRVTAAAELGDGTALVKLERSPFYAEGGGQVSDVGEIAGSEGRARVIDAFRLGDDQVLRVRLQEGALPVGAEVTATVDAARRRQTQANHTATHVLNWALRETLGAGVRQAGSYVGPDKLRFDFTHRGRVPAETLERIERMVNERVDQDRPVGWRIMGREDAAEAGAIGLFEEKYGERVRVVDTGGFSKELCGGTHVSRTGEIGPFAIVSEGSTGAGARRIEALTGTAALAYLRERERELQAELAARDERIRQLQAELKRAKSARTDVGSLAGDAVEAGGVRALVAQVEAADMDELLAISDRLKQSLGDTAAVVLGAASDGKALVVANLAPGAVAAGLKAGAIIREVAPIVGGGGGGKDAMARAGGRDPSRLPEALDAARAILTADRGS